MCIYSNNKNDNNNNNNNLITRKLNLIKINNK